MSAPPNLVLTTGPQTTQIVATFAIPASAAAGTIVQATVSAFGPLVGSQSTIVVPITEVWHIIDLYVVGSPAGPDATLLSFINGYIQNIQPALSTLNINLLTRFRLPQSLPMSPATTFASSISLLAANGSSPVTQTVFYQITRAPFTGTAGG